MSCSLFHICWQTSEALLQASLLLSGLIVSHTYSLAGLRTLSLCASRLGADSSRIRLLNSDTIVRLVLGPTLATGVTIAICCAMMVIFRAWMLWKQQQQTGRGKAVGGKAIPVRAGWWFIILADGLLVPACNGLALTLVILLAMCLLLLAAAYLADKAARSALDSGIGASLASRARIVWDAVSNLSDVWSAYSGQAPNPTALPLSAQISTAMDSLSSLLQSRIGEPCPERCLDLSSFDVMLRPPLAFGYGLPDAYPRTGSNIAADGGSCLCDLSRMDLVQPLASQAWRGQLIWAALGYLIAYLGTIWLMMGLITNRERVACERRHGSGPSKPRGAQRRGGAAVTRWEARAVDG